MSAGLKFKQAIANNHPLQVVGTINAYTAMMAEKNGSSSNLPFRCRCREMLHLVCLIWG